MIFAIIILITIVFIQEYILIKKLIRNTNRELQLSEPMIITPEDQFKRAKELTNPELPLNIPPIYDPIKEYDLRKIYDPLEYPSKRPEKYIIGDIGIRKYLNLATRGYPDNFHLIGTIYNDDSSDNFNKVLKLFGRQKYPRSTEYEYYTLINVGNDNVKVNLNNKKELYDNDKVNVFELNKEYSVKLYKNDEFQYNPFY
jgi:hypothetical protein